MWRTSPSRYSPVTTGARSAVRSASARAISPMVCGSPLPLLYARRRPRQARPAGPGRRCSPPPRPRTCDEVPALPAVLEHPGRLAALERGAEERGHARVGGVARHARAVDVVVAQATPRPSGGAGPRPRPGAPGRVWWPRRRCAGRSARPPRPGRGAAVAALRARRLEPSRVQVRGPARPRPHHRRAAGTRSGPRRRRPSNRPAPAAAHPPRPSRASSTAVPRSLQRRRRARPRSPCPARPWPPGGTPRPRRAARRPRRPASRTSAHRARPPGAGGSGRGRQQGVEDDGLVPGRRAVRRRCASR